MSDPRSIRSCLHLRSAPPRVYEALSTDAGRESFWVERSRSNAASVELHFPNDIRFLSEIESRHAPDAEGMPGMLRMTYLDDTRVTFTLRSDGAGGTDLEVEHRDVPEAMVAENRAGWVSVLMALKASLDHGIDLRNHDLRRTWDQGYVEN